MSYLPISEQNQNAPTGQTTNAPSSQTAGTPPPQTGGSAGAGSTTAPSGSAATASPTQFGSSASKLSDYLTANAPQIQSQAQNIAGNLNTQYGQVGTDINNAVTQFGQQVQGGYAAPNQDLVNQAAANPTQFVAASPNNVSNFQKQLNDIYTGPTNFENTNPYSNIQNEVNTATQNANLLGTQTGLQNYLAGTQGGNQTQASNTLDALLLQGNPQAQQLVSQAAQQFQTLPGQFTTATANADQSVQAAQKAAQDAAQYAQSQINPVATQFQTGLTNQLNTTNANEAAYNQAITADQQQAIAAQQALNNAYPGLLSTAIGPTGTIGNPNSDQAAANYITNLFSPGNTAALNALKPYLSGQPITQPGTLADTATAQQYGEDAALAQLLGTGYTPALNQANSGQAGTYNIPTLPGTLPNTGAQLQYEQDLANLYGNSQDSPEWAGAFNNLANPLTPAQAAQTVENMSKIPGQGFAPLNPTQQQALQRLINGETGFTS